MNIHKINEFDLIVDDYENKFTRIIILNRLESLKPIYYTIPFGKDYTKDLTLFILYRTSEEFINGFIDYATKHSVYQQTLENVLKEKEKKNEVKTEKDEQKKKVQPRKSNS